MKTSIFKFLSPGALILFAIATHSSAFAQSTPALNWVGHLQCKDNTDHSHEAQFIRQQDGETFKIVDSEDFVNNQCALKESSLLEIEGEKTNRFLFWGGNLKIKNATVLSSLGEIPHQYSQSSKKSKINKFRDPAQRH